MILSNFRMSDTLKPKKGIVVLLLYRSYLAADIRTGKVICWGEISDSVSRPSHRYFLAFSHVLQTTRITERGKSQIIYCQSLFAIQNLKKLKVPDIKFPNGERAQLLREIFFLRQQERSVTFLQWNQKVWGKAAESVIKHTSKE